jgi:hypothetical protein
MSARLSNKLTLRNNFCIDTNDTYQKIQVIFIGTVELIKIALASLLSIFVPQNCATDTDTYMNTNTNTTINNYKVCSIIDNFTDLSNFNILVIIFNFALFGLFIFTFIYEIKREYFMIDNFDREHKIPDDNLGKIIDLFPDIKIQLLSYNNYYHNLCKSLYILFIINWILSGILVFHYFYLDKNTVSTMIANFLLVSNTIHKGYIVSRTSRDTPSISSFMTENLIYNIMDVRKYKNNQPFVELTDIRDIKLSG